MNGLLYIDLERVIPKRKNRAVSKSTNSLRPPGAADISMLAVREHMRIFGFAGTTRFLEGEMIMRNFDLSPLMRNGSVLTNWPTHCKTPVKARVPAVQH